MLAGFFVGIVHDRKLMREAQVNIAIRWFAGCRLNHELPDHSSLTRIRKRWGAERFRRIFQPGAAVVVAVAVFHVVAKPRQLQYLVDADEDVVVGDVVARVPGMNSVSWELSWRPSIRWASVRLVRAFGYRISYGRGG